MADNSKIFPARSELKEGINVQIKDNDGQYVTGIIKKIITPHDSHWQGIKVELTINEITGRVQKIVSLQTEEEIIIELIQELKKNLKLFESSRLEFKTTFLFDYHRFEQRNEEFILEKNIHSVAKTIAAFANHEGGTLYIGIKDNKEIFGLEKDYALLQFKQNADGFMNILKKKMDSMLGEYTFRNCIIFKRIITVENKDICIIKVAPMLTPVLIKNEEMYVRDDDTSNPYDIINFCQHWCKHLKTMNLIENS